MTEAERIEVQSRIVSALRKLIAGDSQNELGEMWIETGIGPVMAYVDVLDSGIGFKWRSPLGRNNIQGELEELIAIYQRLASKMSQVHQPTHEILSQIGIGPFFEKTRCENFIEALRIILASDEFSQLPENVGRGRSRRIEDNIADSLATIYFNITGKRPSRAYDPIEGKQYAKFPDLVREVFQILGIKKGAQDCAKRAIGRYVAGYGEKEGSNPLL